MKLLLLVAFFGVTQLSFSVTHSKKPELAVIYVYRTGQFSGSLSNWSIFVDELKICKLSNNKYIKIPIKPGKHTISAKLAGVSVMKKETEIEINAESGGNYYVACNIKQSIMRARLEMIEVTKSTGSKQMEKMTMDNCETNTDEK